MPWKFTLRVLNSDYSSPLNRMITIDKLERIDETTVIASMHDERRSATLEFIFQGDWNTPDSIRNHQPYDASRIPGIQTNITLEAGMKMNPPLDPGPIYRLVGAFYREKEFAGPFQVHGSLPPLEAEFELQRWCEARTKNRPT